MSLQQKTKSTGTLGKPESASRPIKIHVLRNGEASFKGVSVLVRLNQTFDRLYADTTKAMVHKVFVQRGGVTAFYTLEGNLITTLEELEDGVTYVAICLNERFKVVKYPSVPARPFSAKSGLSVRTATPKSRTSLRSEVSSRSGASLPGRLRPQSGSLLHRKPARPEKNSCNIKPRWVTIVRYGFKPRNIFRHMLSSKNVSNIEQVLSNISELVKLDAGPMYKLYFESCVEVTKVEDFFGNHFIFFAFPKTTQHWDDFELDVQEIEIIEKMNKITARDQKAHDDNLPSEISSIYEIRDIICCGCFSVLKECLDRKTGERYAMKIINKITGNEIMDNYLSVNRNELKILKGMEHENILRVFFDFESQHNLYFVVELFEGGDLKSLIDSEKIGEDDALRYTSYIASALSHLHSHNIVHRDVSPSNLMIKLDGRNRKTLKLTDFGLAKTTTEPLFEICGFLLYMAPEMLMRTGYGVKVDIWAAGVTLYYMLAKCLPFMGNDVDQSRRMIVNGDVYYESPQMQRVTEATKYLISLMLYRQDERRYTADEVLAFVEKARDNLWEDLCSFKDANSIASSLSDEDVFDDVVEDVGGDVDEVVDDDVGDDVGDVGTMSLEISSETECRDTSEGGEGDEVYVGKGSASKRR